MLRNILIIGLLLISINSIGQIPIKDCFYRLDTLENNHDFLKFKYSLTYTEISNNWSDIWYAIFPIDFIKSADSIPDYWSFNIKDNDSSIFTSSKLQQDSDGYYSELDFSNQFNGKGEKIYKKIIRINQLDSSNILIDNKIFKLDSSLKIFQRFTGY